MKKIAITSDCTCDLSDKILEEYGIQIFYCYIDIDNGCFKDTEEITAENIIEYLDNGGKKMMTYSPDAEEISEFYQRVLEKYDEIIHISLSSKLADAYKDASVAAKNFGGRVYVIDGLNLSTGTAHMVIRAAELVRENKDAEEIVAEIEEMKQKISTTFIMDNADCFYRTGRVGKFTKELCTILKIHPVITMKDGNMRLKGIRIGNYENAALRYVKSRLRNLDSIDKKRIFITHPNCRLGLITRIKRQVTDRGVFENIYVTRASATVTGNCGANTVGLLFVRK